MGEGDQRSASFGEVFAVGEFRALFTAQVLSIAGDQLARVALSLLVFDRTHSAALTALTYALTFLPDLIGGPLLAGLADRYRRRELMVVTDVLRAGLVGLMAIPGTSFVILAALLIAVQLLASPFNAARAAVLPSILEGDRFVVGQGIINITYQLAALAGYVGGGVVVTFTGTSVSLLLDALTFLSSAALIAVGLKDRPVPVDGSAGGRRTTLRSLREGARLVWHDRKLRVLITLGCISGFYIAPEALAVPYGAELGGGPVVVGLLFAAPAAGTVIGMLLLTRLVPPAVRISLLGVLSVASSAVLIGCAARPGLVVTLVLFALSGAAAAHQTIVAATFMQTVPDAQRGQAFGLAHTSIRVVQGLGAVLAGAAAEGLAPSVVVAGAGTLGTLSALLAAITWHRVRATGVSPVDLAH